MKGAIYLGFADFVESKFSLTLWLQTIENCELPSDGEYLSTELYDDNEFSLLLAELSQTTEISQEQLKRDFGQYFFPTLMSLAQQHVDHIDNLTDFLIAVDNIIHVEVQKSDPLAYTPNLFYDQPDSNTLIMRYVSKRQMCHFAEGLILGAAEHFNQPVKLEQQACMCKGDKHCLIKITQLPH